MLKKIIALLVFSSLIGCGTPATKSAKEKIQEGEELFNSYSCTKCHSITGKEMYGPALNAILNTSIVTVREGKETTAKIDREFIKRSIEDPNFEKNANFREKKMPKPALTQEEIELITDYLIFINSKN